MLWLYIDFPRLQLNLLESQNQDAKASAIIETGSNQLVQLNQSAQQYGIQAGMGLATALALHRQLNIFEYQARLETDHLTTLAQAIYPVCSGIAIQPPRGLLLEVSSMLLYHKNINNYWRQINQHFKGLDYHFSTAYSPLSAKLLAQAKFDQLSDNKEFIGLALKELALTALPLDPKVQKKLLRLGLKKIAQLQKLPPKEIAKRFDIDLSKTLEQLNNELKTPLPYFHPRQNFHQYLQLFYEISSAQQLLKPLFKLLLQLQQFLQQRNAVAEQVNLRLLQRDKERQTLSLRSGQGIQKAELWQEICRLQLERLQLTSPIEAIELSCSQYQQQGSQHQSLFKQQQNSLERQQLIDHLQARLGPKSLFRLAAGNSHIPELNQQVIDYDSDPAAIFLTGGENPKPLRPWFLMQQPQALNQALSLVHGPERIQGLWWRGNEVERDYYIARSPQGRWCWVFKNRQQHWFLQGYFA